MIDRKHFVDTILPIAGDEEKRSGIKPLITITQAAHESNWGDSGLTRQANNLFGFTGESWATEGKPVIKMKTQEFVNGHYVTVERPFRAYSSWAESVRDWANLIQKPRYAKAYDAAKAGDMTRYATEVAAAGYATDPRYGDRLSQLGEAILAGRPELGNVA